MELLCLLSQNCIAVRNYFPIQTIRGNMVIKTRKKERQEESFNGLPALFLQTFPFPGSFANLLLLLPRYSTTRKVKREEKNNILNRSRKLISLSRTERLISSPTRNFLACRSKPTHQLSISPRNGDFDFIGEQDTESVYGTR
jgi:hypothetical protein